jgi:hypothetical protein
LRSGQHEIEVAPRVWNAWRKAAQTGDEWELRLALVGDGPPEDMQTAFGRIVKELERATADPTYIGEWWSAVLDGCLVIRVAESDDFEATLADVCSGLARLGVAGTIDVWEPAPGFAPPELAPMLCCGVRVRGERHHRGEGRYHWTADADAYARVLAAAVSWCGVAVSLQTAATGWVALDGRDGEQLVPAMTREVGRRLWCAVASGDAGAFRAAQANTRGSIVLIAGGVDDWERALESLRAFLGEVAGELVYGAVRRGWKARAALDDGRLPADWPRRPAERPRGNMATATAFEDLLAPDAFGVQLLGASYASRLELDAGAAGRWHTERVGDATLLAHAEPARWFAAPPTRQAGHDVIVAPDASDLLTTARHDLRAIVYEPGVLASFGFGDMAER